MSQPLPPTMSFALSDIASDEVTIGVALAIPQPWGEFLQQQRADIGDPQAYAIPAHITLLPPTIVAKSLLPKILEHLRREASLQQPFTVRLQGTGTFRPTSPVVFVKVAAGKEELDDLQTAVRTGELSHRDLKFSYHPHVTVAHDISEDLLDVAVTRLADFQAEFTADRLTFYEHGEDDIWRARHEYFLGDS